MNQLSKHLFTALLGAAVLSSCSRPVAYFQPSARENFKSVQPQTVATATPADVAPTTENNTEAVAVAPAATAPVEQQLAQTKQAVNQVEAYVRNDSKLASNKKLAKRMARLNEMLATTSTKVAVSSSNASNVTATKKMSLAERVMLKKIDKKIKNHVAPDETKAMTSNVRLGIIIGIVGLLLLILGGGTALGVIGAIGLIVGLVLILIGVINA